MDQEELFRRLASRWPWFARSPQRGRQTCEEKRPPAHRRSSHLRATGLLGRIRGAHISQLPIVLAAGLSAFAGVLAAFSFLEVPLRAENFSVTGIVTPAFSPSCSVPDATLGNETVAVAAAVAMTILLALREPRYSWVRNVTWPKRSVLVLLAMSFLLLPILRTGLSTFGRCSTLRKSGCSLSSSPLSRLSDTSPCACWASARASLSLPLRKPGFLYRNHALLRPPRAGATRRAQAPARGSGNSAGRHHY